MYVFHQVLHDLEQQEQVTQIVQPILTIQLVLNVPVIPKRPPSQAKRRNSRRDSVNPVDPNRARRRSFMEVKKAVKFTDQQESSGTPQQALSYDTERNGFKHTLIA